MGVVFYLVVLIVVIIVIGENCYKNGKYFLADALKNKSKALLINKMLRIGFYLLNLGGVFLTVKSLGKYNEFNIQYLEECVSRVGAVVLTLGLLHIVNIIWITIYALNKTALKKLFRFTNFVESLLVLSLLLLCLYYSIFYTKNLFSYFFLLIGLILTICDKFKFDRKIKRLKYNVVIIKLGYILLALELFNLLLNFSSFSVLIYLSEFSVTLLFTLTLCLNLGKAFHQFKTN